MKRKILMPKMRKMVHCVPKINTFDFINKFAH